jgi:hypothetical protein
MDIRNIRNQAINLYQQGKSIQEINKQTGIPLSSDTIEKWIHEEHINGYKSVIFYLDKKQKREPNSDKRKEILLELKQKLKDILEIVPDDVDMQIKLMYTYINLSEVEQAKNVGYMLFEKNNSNPLLNGLSIIEEKLGNYDKSIEFIEQILSTEPDNEFYKNKLQRLQNRNEHSDKDKLYAQIATLERNTKKLIEKKINELATSNQKIDQEQINVDIHKEVYGKVRILADKILEKYPDEVIAKEKLIKSLYIIGEYDTARTKGEEFLPTLDKDEIIIWYMAKIEYTLGNFNEEKAYLEKFLKVTHKAAPIQIQKRLSRVNSILKRQEEKLKEEQQKQEQLENLTEEDREIWINNIQKRFKDNGNISVDYLDEKINEARNYPNYAKSLVSLLDMKSMITEDYENELQTLQDYLDTEYSISREDYKYISDAISRTRKYHNIKQSYDSCPNCNLDDYAGR